MGMLCYVYAPNLDQFLDLANIEQIRNDSADIRTSKVLVGLGDDFESANAAVMYHARDIIASTQAASGEQQKEVEALNDGDEKTKLWAENWYDGLTYCKCLLVQHC